MLTVAFSGLFSGLCRAPPFRLAAASEVGRRLRAAAPENLPLRPPEVLQFDLLFCSANLFFPPLIEFCTVVFFPFLLP